MQQAFEQVLRLLFTIVLARFVAPEDFGLMGMAYVVTYLAILVGDLGVGAALVQRRELRPSHITTAFTISSLGGVSLALLAALTAGPVSAFFGEPRLAPVLVVVGLTFVCKGVQGVPRDLLRRDLRFRPYAATAAIALVLGVTVGTVAGVLGAGVWALVAYSVVESVTAMVLSLAVSWRAGLWRPAIGIERAAARDLAGFAGYLLGARGLFFVQNSADNVVVGRFLGTAALGYYSLAYRTMLVPVQKVADVVSQVAVPALATVQDDPGRLHRGALQAQRAAAAVVFPMSIGMAAVTPLALPLVLGAQWAPAVVTVQILALNGPRLVLARLAASLFQATGRPAWDFWLLAAGVPLSVVAYVIGAQHSIEAVAIGLTVVGSVLMAVQLVLVARALDTSTLTVLRNLAGVTCASGALVLGVVAIRAATPPALPEGVELVLAIAAGATMYVAALVAVDRQVLVSLAGVAGWGPMSRREVEVVPS
jgi:O-antigen/teichoic acid export membrane protein